MPDLREVTNALTATNFLSQEAIHRRARLLFRDLTRLQIEGFRVLPIRRYPFNPSFNVQLAEYQFGPVDFSLENAKDPASVRKTVGEMEGTAINREEILYLSKVCEMAHALIPNMWTSDKRLIRDVRRSRQHLDTLNEIWWLGRWNGLSEQSLKREVALLPTSAKSVDWQFPLVADGRAWTFNLEVKRLIHSIGARAYAKNHWFYKAPLPDGSFDDADPRLKFRRSLDSEINILGVTWFDAISVELKAEIQRFLDEDDKIDVVIIWSPDYKGGGWFSFFPKGRDITEKQRAISSVLLEPDDEDRSRIIAFMFPRTLASIQAETAELAKQSR